MWQVNKGIVGEMLLPRLGGPAELLLPPKIDIASNDERLVEARNNNNGKRQKRYHWSIDKGRRKEWVGGNKNVHQTLIANGMREKEK